MGISVPVISPIRWVSPYGGVERVLVKDESVQPTHTFKDRLAYEMIRPMAEQLQAGKRPEPMTFASISYGNTAKSMGHYCRLLNQQAGEEVARAIAFVPPHLVKRLYGPSSYMHLVRGEDMLANISQDCHILEIDLEERVWRAEDLEVKARAENLVMGEFVDITEGLDRVAYVNIIREAIEQQLTSPPDYCIVPFGAGILCNEILDYITDHQLPTKLVPVSSGHPKTIATMLYGPIWVDTVALREQGVGLSRHNPIDRTGRERVPYSVYHVEDAEIDKAMTYLNGQRIGAEPSGASGFALLKHLSEIDPTFDKKNHSVLVINTGNGLANYRFIH